MRAYSAIIDKSRSFHGGLFACLRWAEVEVERDPDAVAKVLKVRPGEKKGKIVWEVSRDGFRPILHGRQLNLKDIRRLEPKPGG